jgi:hypothetical protein
MRTANSRQFVHPELAASRPPRAGDAWLGLEHCRPMARVVVRTGAAYA